MYCVLGVAAADDTNASPNSIIFTIKETNLFILALLYQQNTIRNYQMFLTKTWNISVLEW